MVSYNSGVALKGAGTINATVSKLAVQPLPRDAALDIDIIYHEVGHGVTWRMVGRMSGPLSGAIGEGFADGLALLMNSHNDVIGEYSSGSPYGIRRDPYTNYPRTYGSVDGAGVHADGEIYAAIVWKLILDFGPTRREQLFRYVIDGLNYTRADPAYEDMRDGMLASIAADPNGGNATCALVWDAFARYGVGVGAKGKVQGRRVVITESSATSSTCN
jgi:Zn-dependent metalloprotease